MGNCTCRRAAPSPASVAKRRQAKAASRQTCQGRFVLTRRWTAARASRLRPVRALSHEDARKRSRKRKGKMMSDEAALDTGVKNRKPSLIAYQVREGKDEQSYWDRI